MDQNSYSAEKYLLSYFGPVLPRRDLNIIYENSWLHPWMSAHASVLWELQSVMGGPIASGMEERLLSNEDKDS